MNRPPAPEWNTFAYDSNVISLGHRTTFIGYFKWPDVALFACRAGGCARLRFCEKCNIPLADKISACPSRGQPVTTAPTPFSPGFPRVPTQRIMGMQVIDSKGRSIGIERDIRVNTVEKKINLIVTTKAWSELQLPWEDIQSIVVCSPSSTPVRMAGHSSGAMEKPNSIPNP